VSDADPIIPRAIVVVARFPDQSRRARICESVEQVRAFLAGEDVYTGRHPYRERVGRGTLERKIDCGRDVPTSHVLDALKTATA
jgi:hypothetical protein